MGKQAGNHRQFAGNVEKKKAMDIKGRCAFRKRNANAEQQILEIKKIGGGADTKRVFGHGLPYPSESGTATMLHHLPFFSRYSFIASFTMSLKDIFFSMARYFMRVWTLLLMTKLQ